MSKSPATLAILILCLMTNSSSAQTTASEVVVRVLSYNIHHGRGMDGAVDLQRIAATINECKPDLVALQEVDVGTERTGRTDQVAELAKLTGLHARFVKQIDYEGGSYGQAILSRWPLSEPEIEWLPGEPPRERRIVGMVRTVGPDSPPLVFGTTHLHHNNAAFRLRQAEKLIEIVNLLPAGRATIVAGDFNAEPDSEVLQRLEANFAIFGGNSPSLTFPADAPSKQIDFVIGSPADAFETESVSIAQSTTASDHLPLLAIVKLRLDAK